MDYSQEYSLKNDLSENDLVSYAKRLLRDLKSLDDIPDKYESSQVIHIILGIELIYETYNKKSTRILVAKQLITDGYPGNKHRNVHLFCTLFYIII